MARIAVVSSHPPFTEGGHLVIARSLVGALREAGHEADVVLTPQTASAGRARPTSPPGSPTSARATAGEWTR